MKFFKIQILNYIISAFILINSSLMFFGNLFLETGNKFKTEKDFKKAISSYKIATYFTPFYSRIYYEWGYILNKIGIKDNEPQNLYDSIKLFELALIYNPGFYRAEILLLETKEYLRLLKKPFLDYLFELNKKYPNNVVINKILSNEVKIHKRNEYLKLFKIKWLQEFNKSMNQIEKSSLKTFLQTDNVVQNGNLYSSSEILALVRIDANDGHINISAKSSHVNGIYAKMEVSLNEKKLGEVFVTSENFSSYIFKYKDQIKGDGILSIKYTNDEISKNLNQDRNLYINFVEIFWLFVYNILNYEN